MAYANEDKRRQSTSAKSPCNIATLLIVSLVLVFLTSCSSGLTDVPGETELSLAQGTEQSDVQGKLVKFIAVGDNLVVDDSTFMPLPFPAFATALGEQHGVTDKGLQVFAIANQDANKSICLIDKGQEQIYIRHDGRLPTLNSLSFSSMQIDGETNDVVISDPEIVLATTKRICEEYLVDPPQTVDTYLPISNKYYNAFDFSNRSCC
ncbi:MAG: hypothetical protein LBG97_03865 [Coriobacteriales bacterium]|jgi:hypothetical protein|nr:hypothetical protein [Coriobacteriales bacterium]